jgi:hypothetical protein
MYTCTNEEIKPPSYNYLSRVSDPSGIGGISDPLDAEDI